MTRRPLLIVLVPAAILAAATASSPSPDAHLQWAAPPQVLQAPTGIILTGDLRNASGDRLRLRAEDVRVLDASRRALPGVNARFTLAWGHSLYGASGGPAGIGISERRRLGLEREVAAGAATPIVVAWRTGDARTLALGQVEVALPDRVSRRAGSPQSASSIIGPATRSTAASTRLAAAPPGQRWRR